MSTTRYAIYFVPPTDSAIYRLGAALLGYDAFTGFDVQHPPQILESIPDWNQLTTDPRKYGFHATLKAPFSLKNGVTENNLKDSFEKFARTSRIIPSITPVVQRIGSFIAITPETASTSLSQLADDCVTTFESLRAPLTQVERARRLKSPLTQRQIAHLDRWGYPYVFEEFRFHMTLTGPLIAPKDRQVLSVLRNEFEPLHVSPLAIDHIALLRQGRDGRFLVVEHAALTTCRR